MSKNTVEVWGIHELNEQEIEKKRSQIGEIIEEKSRLEKKIKDLADRTKDYKDLVKSAEARLKAASDAIRTGKEERYIDCIVKYHPKTETKDLLDSETGELIKTEAMTPDDFQISANFKETQ